MPAQRLYNKLCRHLHPAPLRGGWHVLLSQSNRGLAVSASIFLWTLTCTESILLPTFYTHSLSLSFERPDARLIWVWCDSLRPVENAFDAEWWVTARSKLPYITAKQSAEWRGPVGTVNSIINMSANIEWMETSMKTLIQCLYREDTQTERAFVSWVMRCLDSICLEGAMIYWSNFAIERL